MSGGHFDYAQNSIGDIADEIERLIDTNESDKKNEYGDKEGYFFSPDVITSFKQGLSYLRLAQIYAQRIDLLVSNDEGEDAFREQLMDELLEFEESQKNSN